MSMNCIICYDNIEEKDISEIKCNNNKCGFVTCKSCLHGLLMNLSSDKENVTCSLCRGILLNKDGTYLKYHDNGLLYIVCEYKDGKKHGKCVTWKEWGPKMDEYYYNMGHRYWLEFHQYFPLWLAA